MKLTIKTLKKMILKEMKQVFKEQDENYNWRQDFKMLIKDVDGGGYYQAEVEYTDEGEEAIERLSSFLEEDGPEVDALITALEEFHEKQVELDGDDQDALADSKYINSELRSLATRY
jgi:hypothetical protein